MSKRESSKLSSRSIIPQTPLNLEGGRPIVRLKKYWKRIKIVSYLGLYYTTLTPRIAEVETEKIGSFPPALKQKFLNQAH